jgi:dephospho-CoA kinase
MFAELGAAVVSADRLGRQLMEPGQAVFSQIVASFGPAVVRTDGTLDRKALAELAFQHNQADKLNRIVHPAVVAAEEEWMRGIFAADPKRVAIVESALIFEVEKWGTAPGWTERFDKMILVVIPDEMKITRFVSRMMGDGKENPGKHAALVQDARARLAAQLVDREKISRCEYVIDNSGSTIETRAEVERIYRELVRAAE